MNKGYCELNDVDLKNFNTMQISSIAKQFYIPYTYDGFLKLTKRFAEKSVIILGKGSNTIFSSPEYDKPIICTVLYNRLNFEDGYLVAESGTTLSQLAWFAQGKGIANYEFLEDIPGSLGGALYMNAGTYDDSISNLVFSVTVYDCDINKVVELTKEELNQYWGKRKSYFQEHNCFILKCKLIADSVNNPEDILNKILEIKKKRYLKQPREYPNAGSVFKRPYVDGQPRYVWQLLTDCGLCGYANGGAQISKKHPGFIINTNNCTGEDITGLLSVCKTAVKEKFGITLEEEWKII